MHGGKILARSPGAGKGSQSDILLPALKQGWSESQLSLPATQQAACARQHIILIENNADTNETLQMLLELDGHRTASARDGVTGVLMAVNEAYDVVVCDIGLPDLDGYAVIEQIRQRTKQGSLSQSPCPDMDSQKTVIVRSRLVSMRTSSSRSRASICST